MSDHSQSPPSAPDASGGAEAARALDTSRAMRYEALLQLIDEVQRHKSIEDIAKVVATRWKHCASVSSWRLSCQYEGHGAVLAVNGKHISITEPSPSEFDAYDAELWRRRVPQHLTTDELQAERSRMPPELADPKGQALHVLPVQQGTVTIAMLSVLTHDAVFDPLDRKFNALVGGTIATRVSAILAERSKAAQMKRADKARAEADLLRSTMDSAAMGMAVVLPRTDGLIIDVNKALCSLLKRERNNLLSSKTITELVIPADQPRYTKMIEDLLSGKASSLSIDVELQLDSSVNMPAQIIVALVCAPDGSPSLGIVQVMDLTERREVDRAKNEFIATVSHELRTPLTAIIAATGLFKWRFAEQVSEKGLDLLSTVQRNSDRLLRLINDLLDMEKMLAGQMALELEPLLVSQAIRQVIEMAEPYAKQYEVTLDAITPDVDAQVMVDAHRLCQVLTNLVSNAAKFSPRAGSVTLTTAVSDTHVEISVIDCGAGIPEDFRDQIFQKFRQADSSVTRKKGGTGLGLAISQQLTQLMHGEIGFESQVGHGSRFWVRLPRVV